MFAAAAVAAAAALTAISTTQTSDTSQALKGKLTWSQYASQRRNSLQRRRIEINKRLQKTKSNTNNPNNFATQKTKNNIQKEIEQLKLTATSPKQPVFKSNDVAKGYDINQAKPPPLIHVSASLTKEKIEEEEWFQDLSSKVCNEFIRMYEVNNDSKLSEIDNNLNAAMANPTYKNFNTMAGDMMANQNMLKEGSEFFKTTDRSEISKLLLEYIQSHGHELAHEKNILGQIVQNIDGEKIKLPRPITAKQQKLMKSYEEKVHYRWDPRWLRICRKHLCIPVAIVTFFLLLFANISSNWIYVNDNQKAGLWFFCNSTIKIFDVSTSAASISLSQSSKSLHDSNELTINNKNLNNSFLIRNVEKTPMLHEKSILIENCYATFFFKDNHLAILFLALVGLIFHFVGFVLLIIGLFFSTANRTLYYFHSAGECLVTSSLINGLDMLVFAAVVSSKARSELDKSFKFGYCFYLNLVVIILTFAFSTIFYLDDVVNEYSVWKIKTEERNRRKAAMFVTRKPPQR